MFRVFVHSKSAWSAIFNYELQCKKDTKEEIKETEMKYLLTVIKKKAAVASPSRRVTCKKYYDKIPLTT